MLRSSQSELANMGKSFKDMRLVHFGPFEADFTTGELRKHGIRLKLQDQPFQILKMLLVRAGQLVTREEIQENLWPDGTFVDFDNGLNAAVNRLREALGDSAENPKFIQTLPRRGYRFIGDLGDVAATDGYSRTKTQKGEALRSKGKLWNAVVPAAVLLPILAAGSYFYSHRAPILTDKDSIVLADFTNTTGDPVFDSTLRQGLSIQLDQSPFLRSVSDQQIQQTLSLMGQPAEAKLTLTIAREICHRTSSAAILDGSIAQIGTQYLLTVKAISCASGETVASAEAQASDKNY